MTVLFMMMIIINIFRFRLDLDRYVESLNVNLIETRCKLASWFVGASAHLDDDLQCELLANTQ